ncbi:MAG: CoA transferase, partial [Proteobacteria bacterium]|nr:CoA transferase [Pseudomonadota bacterium]
RAVTGAGARIDLSMFESTVSWLTVPIALSKSFGAKISRRGNTHEFFSPVSVYKTSNGFVYIALGNDRQWESVVSQDIFKSLAKEEYKNNQGRIADAANLNKAINDITKLHTSEELIELFNSITVPISKIKTVNEVIEDPLVARRILSSKDPKTGTKLTLAPPPNMTPFLEECDRKLSFPPRFGEQNQEIYGDVLGYDEATLAEFKKKGII